MDIYNSNKEQLNHLVKNLNKKEIINLLKKHNIPYKEYLSLNVLKRNFVEEVYTTGMYKRIGNIK